MSEKYNSNFEPDFEKKTSHDTADFAQNAAKQNQTADYQSASADNAPTPADRVFSDAQPETHKAYESIYSDSSSFAGHDYSAFEPAKPQDSTPAYAERTASPYTQAEAQPQPTQTSYGYSQPVSNPEQTSPYTDGFYHRSFTEDKSGNNVNYTTPAGTPSPYSSQYGGNTNHTKPPKKKKSKGGLSKGGVALLLVLCLLISGAAGFGGSILASKLNGGSYVSASDDSTMVIHKVNAETATDSSNLVDKTTSEIADSVADTVVEITTEVMQTSSYYGQYIAKGAGSGVIISTDGYIITNNHVIENATSITVSTRSGDSYTAKLIGADAELDIALLKIEASDLSAAVFGDSSALTVGSKAVVIGNPLGTLGGSVTEGIISALDRSIVIDGKTMHLMQTDASINPGNSGGGMFNGQGELTGIVVAKSSSTSTESIDNIGFVIPINNVLDILSDLKDYGYVRGRADTGMSFVDLTNQMYAWYYYGNTEAGVYISSVDSGSNAETAGFRKGDRVISVDGQTVSSSSDITSILSGKSVGDTVTFVLERQGSQGSIDLVLSEAVPETSTSSSENNSFGNSNGNSNGNLNDGLFGAFGN